MLKNYWLESFLIIFIVFLVIVCWRHYRYLISKLRKASYLYYSTELKAAKKKIEKATILAELRFCQNEIDELYDEASRFCKVRILEELFMDINLLLIIKEMDIHKKDVDEPPFMPQEAS